MSEAPEIGGRRPVPIDVEAGKPFTADATLVRPGSISKLFTILSSGLKIPQNQWFESVTGPAD